MFSRQLLGDLGRSERGIGVVPCLEIRRQNGEGKAQYRKQTLVYAVLEQEATAETADVWLPRDVAVRQLRATQRMRPPTGAIWRQAER